MCDKAITTVQIATDYKTLPTSLNYVYTVTISTINSGRIYLDGSEIFGPDYTFPRILTLILRWDYEHQRHLYHFEADS